MAASRGVFAPAGVQLKPGGVTVAMLSNVAVVGVLVVCELAARPIKAVGLKLANVYGFVTWLQELPSLEVEPLNVVPERSRRSQIGTALPVTLVTVVVAPGVGRSWKAEPEGVMPTNAFIASGDAPSRAIRPAFA